jgi:hypothetical protein
MRHRNGARTAEHAPRLRRGPWVERGVPTALAPATDAPPPGPLFPCFPHCQGLE